MQQSSKTEINGVLCHLCAQPKLPEDDEMNEMTLRDTGFIQPWRSEAEHATSRSRRLPTILVLHCEWGRNIYVSSNRQDREPNPKL